MLDERKRKVLLVLRGTDTVGKYGTVKALFTGISPVGLRAVAFRAPNDDELEHDYLWRVHRQVPAVGEIAAFNRSHCEELLVPPVVGWIDADECKRRHGYLRAFQRMLSDTGAVQIKVSSSASTGPGTNAPTRPRSRPPTARTHPGTSSRRTMKSSVRNHPHSHAHCRRIGERLITIASKISRSA